MNLQLIHWPAVIVAALSSFVLGGVWYSPVLFGPAWMRANGLSETDLRARNMGKIFGFSLVFSLLMSANLAAFLADARTTASWGATAGFLAGFGWAALGLAMVALFERRSWRYIAINGGYLTTAFVVMGLILGAWR